MAKKKGKKEKAIVLKLSFSERMFHFGSIFPEQADILTRIVSRDISNKIVLTQIELEKFAPKRLEKGGFEWSEKKNKTKVISFTKPEMSFLKDRVSELDKQKKITQGFLDIALKIQDIKMEESDGE